MSVIRPRPPEEPLQHEARDTAATLAGRADRLAAVRAEVVAAPAGSDLAARMLDDYDARRPESRLFAILTVARRIREAVDRCVIVAGGSISPATRLLSAACCHPFHDQLDRGERGGRPRLCWLAGSAGDDEIQGLLDLLPPGGAVDDDLLDRWAIVAVDAPRDDPRQEAILELLVDRLGGPAGADSDLLAARLVPVAETGSRLAAMAARRGCPTTFVDVLTTGAAPGLFTAAGLLPAAVAGIDVVRLLQGAAAMLRRFAEAPVAENPPLADAAAAARAAATGRPARAFAGTGRWLAELAGWHGVVRPAPAGAAAAVTIVSSGEPRRERLGLAAVAAEGAGSDPDVRIRLPRVDEHAVGQFLQMLILSAAVEERLGRAV